MPCPPSYEERELANLDRSTGHLKTGIEKLKAESEDTLQAIEVLSDRLLFFRD